jgi:hypothetical protein
MTSIFMQSAEKRKNLRRPITYPAFIDYGDGLPARICTLCDVSQQGAQLAVADPADVPEDFVLALSADGAARRRCRVVWRTENQIGVEFIKEPPNGDTRSRVRRPTEVSPAPGPEKPEAPAPRVDVDTLGTN